MGLGRSIKKFLKKAGKVIKKNLPAVIGAVTGNPWLSALAGAKDGGLKGAVAGYLGGGGTVGGGSFGGKLTGLSKAVLAPGASAADFKSLAGLVKGNVSLKDSVKPMMNILASSSDSPGAQMLQKMQQVGEVKGALKNLVPVKGKLAEKAAGMAAGAVAPALADLVPRSPEREALDAPIQPEEQYQPGGYNLSGETLEEKIRRLMAGGQMGNMPGAGRYQL